MRIGISASFLSSEAGMRNAGISRYTREIVAGLARQAPGDEFVVYVTQGMATPESWSRPNVTVRDIVPPGRVARTLWDRSAPRRFGRAERLNVWFSTAHRLPGRDGLPTVSMIHDMIPLALPNTHGGGQARFLRYTLVACARGATRVMVNSEVTKRDVIRFAGVDAEKVVVAPLGPGNDIVGVSPDSVSDGELRTLGVSPGPYFLTLGTREPRKNLTRLFKAFREIPSPWRLVVAGGKGWGDDVTSRALHDLGIADRVDFLGYVPDAALAPLFARARAFAYPSLYEGFGMPTLEAMLGGAPVLTSRGTSMEEVCGDAALYFDPTSVDDIARTLTQATHADFPADAMRAQGFERTKEMTWDACARITARALREVVGKI